MTGQFGNQGDVRGQLCLQHLVDAHKIVGDKRLKPLEFSCFSIAIDW